MNKDKNKEKEIEEVKDEILNEELNKERRRDQDMIHEVLMQVLGRDGLDIARKLNQEKEHAPRELTLVKIDSFYGKEVEDPTNG
jgi:hypothetical protein